MLIVNGLIEKQHLAAAHAHLTLLVCVCVCVYVRVCGHACMFLHVHTCVLNRSVFY